MKKMKKAAAACFTTTVLLGGVVQVIADEYRHINGNDGQGNESSLQVDGIIGEFDNTDVSKPNPPDINQWINVTFPARTLFYTTRWSDHREIMSPEHEFVNHSGRGVQVLVTKVTEARDMEEVDYLEVNKLFPVIIDGKLVPESEFDPPKELFVLTDRSDIDSVNTLFFTGNATPVEKEYNMYPEFELHLKFIPTDNHGVPLR